MSRTLGPWHVEHEPTGNRLYPGGGVPRLTICAGGVQVARLIDGDDADAWLMAAAPELLEALKTVAASLKVAIRTNLSRELYDSDDEYTAAIVGNVALKAATAAIEKATSRFAKDSEAQESARRMMQKHRHALARLEKR